MNIYAGLVDYTGGLARGRPDAFPSLVNFQSTFGRHLGAAPELWSDGCAAMGTGVAQGAATDSRLRAQIENGLSHALVFDGRIDNREELSRRLALNRRDSRDSAIVLAAIERWGDEAPRYLLGDFCYASWDIRQQRLTMVRDISGVRTLFYHHRLGVIAYSSGLLALLASNQVPHRLDDATLADFLLGGAPGEGGTVWADIAQVPPASRVIVDARGIRVERYWDFDLERRIVFRRDDDYVDAARELLDQAVACRLPADGKVAVWLSGGLDSSGIAATAAKQMAPQAITTLTAVPAVVGPFPLKVGSYADERPYVEAIARGLPNLSAEFHAQPLAEPGPSLDEAFLRGGMPLRNTLNIEWFYAVNRRAQDLGIGVLLSGGFGNLSLSYDGMERLPTLANSGQWRTYLRELVATAAYLQVPITQLVARTLIRDRLPRGLLERLQRQLGRHEAVMQAWTGINPQFAEDTDAIARRAAAGIDRLTAMTQNSRQLRAAAGRKNWRIRYGYSIRRAQLGMDLRMPLMDQRLIEFCLAIPDAQYLRCGQTRSLARRVLADRLPGEVLNNTLRGHQCPEWHQRMYAQRERLREQLDQIAQSPLARQCLDIPRLTQALQRLDSTVPMPGGLAAMHGLHRSLHQGRFLCWVEQGGMINSGTPPPLAA